MYSQAMDVLKAWEVCFENKPNKISMPADVLGHFKADINKRVESFFVVTLDGSHRVIKKHKISSGLVNRALVHPRELFFPAIKDNAAAIIIAHNHPSGNLTPSTEDDTVTERIKNASETLGIPLLDHIVFGKTGYFSYLENNKF